MAGSSTIGKGDTSRSGLRGDMKGGGYGTLTRTQSAPGKGANLAGYTSIASAPKTVGGKTAVEKPPAKLPAPTGVTTVTSVTTKNIPRAKTIADVYGVAKAPTKYTPGSYAAYRKALAAKKPVVKPTAKKPPKIAASMLRSALGLAPTKSARVSTKPPATRFGVVTGKTTGTRVSGGGGYGGGGTRGGGSLSGQGSGSRSAGTSRTGGTQRNDPVRG